MPFTLNAFAWCKKENLKRSVEPHGSTDLSRLTYISVNLCMIKPNVRFQCSYFMLLTQALIYTMPSWSGKILMIYEFKSPNYFRVSC